MVCGIFDTTPEDGTVTTETLNPGRGIKNGDGVARNTNIGSGVGCLTNPRATTKPMLGDAEFEVG